MTLQASGTISLANVNSELGLVANATRSLGDGNVRTLAGVASGLIAMSNLYGKSNGAVGSGYFAGGSSDADYTAEIDGLAFATETAINPTAALSILNHSMAGVNSSLKGYFLGGISGYNSYVNKIESLTFSNETRTTLAAVLPTLHAVSASVNSNLNGYSCGGANNGTNTTEIDGINFATETAINPTAVLSLIRYQLAGISSSIRGYAGGGQAGTYYNEIDGIEFATETAINPTAVLSIARFALMGVNSTLNGYWGGGEINDGNGTRLAEIDGLNFSNETAINPSATLSINRAYTVGVNSTLNGYWGGGISGTTTSIRRSEIDGIAFANESAINLTATLSIARMGASGVQSGSL